jgi:hypothetical protein
MTREYESASSLELACDVAYVLCYIAKIREPEANWYFVEQHPDRFSANQRSTAFGTAVHSTIQRWCAGHAVNWHDEPGQRAAKLLAILPDRKAVTRPLIESAIGTEPLVTTGEGKQAPALTLASGLRLVGYIDLLYRNVRARDIPGWKLGPIPGGILVTDIKTSSDVDKWAKSADDLQTDTQACSYALHACRTYDLDRAAMRWAYTQSKGPKLARAVDTIISRQQAERVLAKIARLGIRRRGLTLAGELEPDYWSCDAYAGCYYHTPGIRGECPFHASTGETTMIQLARKLGMKKEEVIHGCKTK